MRRHLPPAENKIIFARVSQPPITDAGHGFHLLTKPVGPICNLDCKYCFYLEKEKLYPGENQWRMSDAVLEEYIRQYIRSQPAPEINFAWQGGEPTLLGVDFFRKAVALQKKYAGGKTIFNAIQTNGTLLDDEWCEFLAANKFLVGLSIDGPAELHDKYRVDKRQQPTFGAVMRGLELLKKHGVEFNTLTVVNRANSQQPLEVYRFLKSIGSQFLQFIPLVERAAPAEMKTAGYDFAAPPCLKRDPDGDDRHETTARHCRSSPSRRGASRRSNTGIFSARFLTNGCATMSGKLLCNCSTWRSATGWGLARRSASSPRNAARRWPSSTTATSTVATITFIRATSSAT